MFRDFQMVRSSLILKNLTVVITFLLLQFKVSQNITLMDYGHALKRAKRWNNQLLCLYYGYARQDRKARSWTNHIKLVANMLEVDRLLWIVVPCFSNSRILLIFCRPLGAPLIADYFDRAGLTGDDVVAVSPDHGGDCARKSRSLLENTNCNHW